MIPTYTASGGVVFQREHVPMTMRAAVVAVSLHRMNASYQLTQSDESTLARRLEIAKTEMALANELEAAIKAASQPEQRAAA